MGRDGKIDLSNLTTELSRERVAAAGVDPDVSDDATMTDILKLMKM